MGSDPERPQIGRHSLYFKWWTAANGEPPRRGQAMTPATFSEGQIYLVRVEDAIVDGHQKAKHDGEAYSRVTELLEVSRPQSSNHSISQSLNHESSNHSIRNQVINESPNQAINQSSRPPGDVSPLKDQSFASAGRGNANPKQTPRAGASVPAQASSQATTDVCEIVEELLRTAPMAEEQPQKQKRARSQAKKSYSVANYH
jgi:hypothetical protein